MDLWRTYFWLWVMGGMIFVSVLISLIFILINKCLSRAGKHRISQFHTGSDVNTKCSKYQEEKDNPPLPPRTQFTTEAESCKFLVDVPQDEHDYEQVEPDYEQDEPDYEQDEPDYEHDEPDYEQDKPDYEQDKPDYKQDEPDYEQDEPDYEQDEPDYEQDEPDYEQDKPDYEQDNTDYKQNEPVYEQDEPDYEQDEPDYEQDTFDYVKVEDENVDPPHWDPAADGTSTEDYDDIAGEEELLGEEDYDDVG